MKETKSQNEDVTYSFLIHKIPQCRAVLLSKKYSLQYLASN